MNVERVLREVERRLAHLPEKDRAEVLDAVQEELTRERRRLEPVATVEVERERRLEAETLREILEAINRQARLSETIHEVLKQLGKIVVFDSCALGLREPSGGFRILAVRGLEEADAVVGRVFDTPLTSAVVASRWPLTLSDVREDVRWSLGEESPIRSWAGMPLLVEGEVIGLLVIARHNVDPFQDEDLHRAKAVAFSAAAAIRKAQLLDQVRRYALSMECVVAVDQAVFSGRDLDEVATTILEGALGFGRYDGGMLVVSGPAGPRVAASSGDAFAGAQGRPAPKELDVEAAVRLEATRTAELGRSLGLTFPAESLLAVPFGTPDVHLGALVLLDPDGETPDDRLMGAFASRAAAAYLHALRRR